MYVGRDPAFEGKREVNPYYLYAFPDATMPGNQNNGDNLDNSDRGKCQAHGPLNSRSAAVLDPLTLHESVTDISRRVDNENGK